MFAGEFKATKDVPAVSKTNPAQARYPGASSRSHCVFPSPRPRPLGLSIGAWEAGTCPGDQRTPPPQAPLKAPQPTQGLGL